MFGSRREESRYTQNDRCIKKGGAAGTHKVRLEPGRNKGKHSTLLVIGKVLCGERAKMRVEWRGWRGEWFLGMRDGRGKQFQSQGPHPEPSRPATGGSSTGTTDSLATGCVQVSFHTCTKTVLHDSCVSKVLAVLFDLVFVFCSASDLASNEKGKYANTNAQPQQ